MVYIIINFIIKNSVIICSSSQFFTQSDTFSLCVNSMEEDQFFVIICFYAHYIKKDRPAPLSSHHQLHANIEYESGRSFVSLPILHIDFVLAYIGISGVSCLSVLISPVQRLTEKRQVSTRQLKEWTFTWNRSSGLIFCGLSADLFGNLDIENLPS